MVVQAKLCQRAALAHRHQEHIGEAAPPSRCAAASRRTAGFKKQNSQLSAIGSNLWYAHFLPHVRMPEASGILHIRQCDSPMRLSNALCIFLVAPFAPCAYQRQLAQDVANDCQTHHIASVFTTRRKVRGRKQGTKGRIDSLPSSIDDAPEEAPQAIMSRRALSGTAAAALSALLLPDLSHWGFDGGQAEAAAASKPLQPLGTYQSQLKEAQDQLDAVGAQLRSMASDDDTEQPVVSDRSAYGKLQQDLHRGQLGRFWAIARGADQYVEVAVPGERGSLARDEVLPTTRRLW